MDYLKMLRKTMGWMDAGFEELYGESPGDSLVFFIATVFLGCAISSTAVLLQGNFGIITIPFFLFIYIVGWGTILPVATHLLLILFGWEKPVRETFKAYFYGATPTLLFGWLPCLGTLSTFVSAGNVIRYLQGSVGGSYWKPFMAVVVPCILIFAVLLYRLFLIYNAP